MDNPQCYLCRKDDTLLVRGYLNPDKYMQSAGIKRGWVWFTCKRCGLYFQPDPMTTQQLENIYSHYRDKSMREISVEEEFDRIMAIPSRESENEYRYRWFSEHYEGGNDMLDIGSGLGVWPYYVKASLGFNVQCVEPNKDCAKFLIDSLNLPCYPGFFIPEAYDARFDYKRQDL